MKNTTVELNNGGVVMNAKLRRDRIIRILEEMSEPVKGAELAKELGVSRQVVVTDIAVLRAQGFDIISTANGYILTSKIRPQGFIATIVSRHDREGIREELETIVDLGGKVLDVTVEHPVYGDLTGVLLLSSRRDVDEFITKLDETNAKPLLVLTEGIHLHKIQADSPDVINEIKDALKRKGYAVDEL